MFCAYPLPRWTTEVYRFSLYRCNRRHPARHLTDLDFADDLALVTELVEDAEDLLQSFEKAAALTGLHCNMNKTDYINTGENHRGMKSLSGVNIKRVEDFKYLGSWIMDSEKDFNSRKALAWVACNRLEKLWHSSQSNDTKIYQFQCLKEPIILYGSETWTLTQKNQKRLDGTYTNLHWNEHPTKERISYGKLPSIADTIKHRRLLFAGHYMREEDEIITSLLLWKKNIPIRSRRMIFLQTLSRDSGIVPADMSNAMLDRDLCKTVVQNIPASGAEGWWWLQYK